MPAQRILRGSQPRVELQASVSPSKTTADTENCDPNIPHAAEESPTKEINFSRKRPLTAIRTSEEVAADASHGSNGQMHTPKRVRSTQQLNADTLSTQPSVQTLRAQRKHASPSASLSRRHASNSARDSRFKEASMHDRISDKPPSMFMRVFGNTQGHGAQDVDQLMEEYHNSNDSPLRLQTPRLQGRTPRPVTRQTQLAGLTQHANTSISVTTTSNATPNTATNDSGIFRFGRSIASAFNPFKAWKSVQRSLKATEEELMRENAQKAAEAEAAERQAQILEAYEELKKSGRIPTKTVIRPTTSMGTRPGDRDSGIQLSSTRSSADLRTSFYDDSAHGSDADMPDRPTSRMSAFHVRRPSLNDLKKLPSQINLVPGRLPSFSLSPEKSTGSKLDDDWLQHSVSKKHLAKQQKLTKQVSDLEARLEKAKNELQSALTETKPLPRLPTAADSIPNTLKTPHKKSSLTKKTRLSMHLPALESIPSERFLLKMGQAENASELSFKCQGNEQQQQPQTFEPELGAIDERRLSVSERSFLNDPSDGEVATPRPHKDKLMMDLAVAQITMINTPPRSSRNVASQSDMGSSPAVGSPAKQTRQSARKRKSRDDNATYRPVPDSADDEAEWNDAANSKSAKKTRPNTRSKTATTTTITKVKLNDKPSNHIEEVVNTHSDASEDPFTAFTTLRDDPVSTTITDLPNRRPLSIVAEETASTTASIAVTLNAEPDRPTAVKTPAAYPSRFVRSGSSSPEKSPVRRRRSQSPPPSSAFVQRTRVYGEEEVRVAPDGVDVPDMPGYTPVRGERGGEGPGSPFQWPEDCF